MLNLSAKNIRLNGVANSKAEAIHLVAQGLVANGNVANGYENGMLAREEQTSTFLGNGIAIPHGTLDTRHLVQDTGVQVYQFPNGVEWGEGNIAYVVIGIAAKSDEHLPLLRQLTTVLSDEQVAEMLAKTANLDEFIATLSGKKALPCCSPELISLDVDTQSLITLSAINAEKLVEKGYANQAFIREVVANAPLALGNNVYLNDSQQGNQQNGVAIARTKTGQTLITVAATDNTLNSKLAPFTELAHRQKLTVAPAEQILALFGAEVAENSEKPTACECSGTAQVVGTFTLRNDNGLHARPATELVKLAKGFEAKITVQNLDRNGEAVNAKSSMKILALGATKGTKLRFVAEGTDAEQALAAIKAGFENGLGEAVSFVPSEADVIEVQAAPQAVETVENSAKTASNSELEAVFEIRNEHGLHARPSAVLVAEVKKYNAEIKVQNLDRGTELVSAKSLMKIVALGVTKGHKLRFVASGEQAQEALDGIGKAIEAGLGE